MLRIVTSCLDFASALFVTMFIACNWFFYLSHLKSYSDVINIYFVVVVGFVFGYLWLLYRYLPLLRQRFPLFVRWPRLLGLIIGALAGLPIFLWHFKN